MNETRIERKPDGGYIVTINGKDYECADTKAMLNLLEEMNKRNGFR